MYIYCPLPKIIRTWHPLSIPLDHVLSELLQGQTFVLTFEMGRVKASYTYIEKCVMGIWNLFFPLSIPPLILLFLLFATCPL